MSKPSDRRYRFAFIYAGLAAVFGFAAFATLPREDAVVFPNALDVRVSSPQYPLKTIMVVVSLLAAHQYRATSLMYLSTPDGPADEVMGAMTLTLPAGVTNAQCQCNHELPGFFGESVVESPLYRGPPVAHSGPAGQWSGGMTVTFTADHFGWDSNGVSFETRLPTAHALGTIDPAADVIAVYNFASLGYQWIGGPSPDAVEAGTVRWREPLSDAGSPVSVAADNPGAMQRDNILTFVAGALVGIFGGFFTNAIQEALKPGG